VLFRAAAKEEEEDAAAGAGVGAAAAESTSEGRVPTKSSTGTEEAGDAHGM
jgi:hypothetical protein